VKVRFCQSGSLFLRLLIPPFILLPVHPTICLFYDLSILRSIYPSFYFTFSPFTYFTSLYFLSSALLSYFVPTYRFILLILYPITFPSYYLSHPSVYSSYDLFILYLLILSISYHLFIYHLLIFTISILLLTYLIIISPYFFCPTIHFCNYQMYFFANFTRFKKTSSFIFSFGSNFS